ncbi:hypothetical protein BH09ACT12_BH09ACT12_33670 [soil metagenome]
MQGSDTVLAPDRLLEVLWRHEVRFVMIGGLAAALHGSPFPTEDLDITPAAGRENFSRLSAALTDLGARIRVDGAPEGLPFAHDAESLAGVGVWNLTTDHGDLDISLVPSGTTGYDDLVRDAEPVEAWEGVVVVASLADVIRSKQAANRPKDQRVLPILREILARRG